VREALGDRSLDVRIAAAAALGRVGDPAADPAALLRSRALPVNQVEAFRAASAVALLRLGDRSGMPDLVAELRSGDVARRTAAAQALAQAGVDLGGYDPDAPPQQREDTVRELERGLGLVPQGTQR